MHSIRLNPVVCFAFVAVHFFACISQSTGQSIENDLRVVVGLRQRRMFELAEQLCRANLGDSELNPTDHISLHLELIHTFVAKAIVESGTARDAEWIAAHKIAQEFLASNSQHPRRILIQVQDALTFQTRGNLIAQEIAAEILGAEHRQIALDELRQSTNLFREIEKLADRMLPDQRTKSLTQHDLSHDQLLNLKRNVRFQQAKSNLIKAQLFPPNDQLNRIDALNRVAKQLKDVLNQSNPDEPLWWQAQFNRAVYLRLSGDPTAAAHVMAQLLLEKSPPRLKAELIEQKIEVAISLNPLGAADSLLTQAAAIEPIPPKLHLAILRLHLAIGSAVESKNDKIQWQNQAAQLTRTIELAHGSYWGRRAELLLIGPSDASATTAAAPATGNLEITMRVGGQAFRAGRFKDAVRAYRRSVQQAEARGNPTQALLANIRLSESFEKLNEYDSAAKTLTHAATKYATLTYAAAAHLRGCWNWSRIAKNDPSRQNEFPQSLRQNIDRWPSSPSADQARIWLAGHHQAAQEYEKAIVLYLGVTPNSPNMQTASLQIINCFQTYKRQNDRSRTHQLARTIVDAAKKKLGLESSDEFEHNIPSRNLLIAVAEIGLSSNTIDLDLISKTLQTQIDLVPDNQLDWKQRARCWQFVAMAAGEVTFERAKDKLTSLPNDSRLMNICSRGLGEISKHGRVSSTSIAQLQLVVAEKAIAAKPNKNEVGLWQTRRARALQDMGQTVDALDSLRQLAIDNPKSLDIQLRFGRALSEINPNSKETLGQWRIVAAKVKPQTSAWYEAKFHVVQSMNNTGESKKALNLLNYINAVHPWNGSNWEKRFEQLQEKLTRSK